MEYTKKKIQMQSGGFRTMHFKVDRNGKKKLISKKEYDAKMMRGGWDPINPNQRTLDINRLIKEFDPYSLLPQNIKDMIFRGAERLYAYKNKKFYDDAKRFLQRRIGEELQKIKEANSQQVNSQKNNLKNINSTVPRTVNQSVPNAAIVNSYVPLQTVNQIVPGTVNQSVPGTVNQSVPVAVNQSFPVAVNQSFPVAVNQSFPVAVNQSVPVAANQIVPVINPSFSVQAFNQKDPGLDSSLAVINSQVPSALMNQQMQTTGGKKKNKKNNNSRKK